MHGSPGGPGHALRAPAPCWAPCAESARRPADAVGLAGAPLLECRPLVGPAVVEGVARRVRAGVLARLLPGRAHPVLPGVGAGWEVDGAQRLPAVRGGADPLLELGGS